MMRSANVVVMWLLVALAIGCGASQREKTLKASLVALNVASETFVAADAKRQGEIVDAATSREQGEAALLEHRKKRDVIADLLIAAYRAVGEAALLSDDRKSLDDMLAAVREVKASLAAWTGGDL